MISWRIIAPSLTAIGALPLFVFAYYAPSPSETVYLFGYLYVCFVIAFIAGIDWIIAIEEQQGLFLVWSILLSMLPLGIVAEYVLLHYDNTIIWGQFILLLMLSLLIDWRLFNKVGVTYYLLFRISGTVLLSLAIVLCIINLL